MGLELTEYLRYAGALFFVLALIGLLVWALKRFGNGQTSSGGKRGRRLAVSEAAMVDKHRRLVLIRRDNQEHLVMIGGPQDLVIETNITPPHEMVQEPPQLQTSKASQVKPGRPEEPAHTIPPAPARYSDPEPHVTNIPPRPRTLDRSIDREPMPERMPERAPVERAPAERASLERAPLERATTERAPRPVSTTPPPPPSSSPEREAALGDRRSLDTPKTQSDEQPEPTHERRSLMNVRPGETR